jgi:hypothetical protein
MKVIGRSMVFVIVIGAATMSRTAAAQRDTVKTQADTSLTHVLRLRDGSTLVGKLLSRDSTTLRFETNGGILTIPAANVIEIKSISAADRHGSEYWFPDANRTRLFFAPTGRMLEKGEGYYSNTYLFLQNFVGAPTDNFTIGGGFSILPTPNFFNDNVYYITPKLGVYSSPNTNAAVGALAGYTPTDNGHSFGILYGVVTRGGPDAAVTGGVGYGYVDGKLANRPYLLLGGEQRLSRRVALVTENYGYWAHHDDVQCNPASFTCQTITHFRMDGAVSYGLRFMGEKLSTDFAFINITTDWIFPGVPYIAFAVKF